MPKRPSPCACIMFAHVALAFSLAKLLRFAESLEGTQNVLWIYSQLLSKTPSLPSNIKTPVSPSSVKAFLNKLRICVGQAPLCLLLESSFALKCLTSLLLRNVVPAGLSCVKITTTDTGVPIKCTQYGQFSQSNHRLHSNPHGEIYHTLFSKANLSIFLSAEILRPSSSPKAEFGI